MTILALTGTIQAPPAGRCAVSCDADSPTASLLLAYTAEHPEILAGRVTLAAVAKFAELGLGAIDTLRFLGALVEEGQTADVELLVGRAAVLLGTAGVFPLVAGGTLAFDLIERSSLGVQTVRFTVSAALQLGDTALQVAARINAAALLVGVLVPVATVVGGQIQLAGDQPGASQAIAVTSAFAGAGFPSLVTPHGTGTALLVDRIAVLSFGAAAGIRGQDVWVRGGPAVLQIVGAGS